MIGSRIGPNFYRLHICWFKLATSLSECLFIYIIYMSITIWNEYSSRLQFSSRIFDAVKSSSQIMRRDLNVRRIFDLPSPMPSQPAKRAHKVLTPYLVNSHSHVTFRECPPWRLENRASRMRNVVGGSSCYGRWPSGFHTTDILRVEVALLDDLTSRKAKGEAAKNVLIFRRTTCVLPI